MIFNFFEKHQAKKNTELKEVKNFIHNYKVFLLKEKIFKSNDAIETFFTQGGCYLFARILLAEFPKGKLIINNPKYHCKFRINGYDFDIYSCEKSSREFRIARKKDIEYMQSCFGWATYKIENEYVEKEIFEQEFMQTKDLVPFDSISKFLNITIEKKKETADYIETEVVMNV